MVRQATRNPTKCRSFSLRFREIFEVISLDERERERDREKKERERDAERDDDGTILRER